MQLTSRQKEITRIVRENGPITGEMIAERLHVTRSACGEIWRCFSREK